MINTSKFNNTSARNITSVSLISNYLGKDKVQTRKLSTQRKRALQILLKEQGRNFHA